MTNKKLNPSLQMRRDFIQASGIAAIAPLIPNFAQAQSTSKSALASSSKGMVTSPHELATEAGLKVLQSGGNAIEAVIAISSCLSVS